MKILALQVGLIGGKYLNNCNVCLRKSFQTQAGFSLLELMAVVLIIAIAAMATMPLLQEQIFTRQIDTIARRFIAHAHFARQQALYLGQPVRLAPRSGDQWEAGWAVNSACIGKSRNAGCIEKSWFSQSDIEPIYFKGGGKQFIDPHTGRKGILDRKSVV